MILLTSVFRGAGFCWCGGGCGGGVVKGLRQSSLSEPLKEPPCDSSHLPGPSSWASLSSWSSLWSEPVGVRVRRGDDGALP